MGSGARSGDLFLLDSCSRLRGIDEDGAGFDWMFFLGYLVVRHVTIFGRGHELQRAIIDESQHRTPERLIMAQWSVTSQSSAADMNYSAQSSTNHSTAHPNV